jgi:hypothetical protein
MGDLEELEESMPSTSPVATVPTEQTEEQPTDRTDGQPPQETV